MGATRMLPSLSSWVSRPPEPRPLRVERRAAGIAGATDPSSAAIKARRLEVNKDGVYCGSLAAFCTKRETYLVPRDVVHSEKDGAVGNMG